MYTTTQAFRDLMAQPSRTLTTRGLITFPDTTTQALTDEEISSIQITEDAGDHLPLGSVSASTVTLKLDNRNGEWNPGGSLLGSRTLDGAIVALEIGVLGDVWEYAKLGTYTLEDTIAQEQDALIVLKGADYLQRGTPFTDEQTYPVTLGSMLEYVCSQAGIPLKSNAFINSDVSVPEMPKWEDNTTCRSVIGYIACCAAGFARVDRDGLLEIVSLEPMETKYDFSGVSFDYTNGDLIFNADAAYTGPTPSLVDGELTVSEAGLFALRDGTLFITGGDYSVQTDRYKKLTRQGAIFGPFNALSIYPYGAPNGYGATRIATDIDLEDNDLNSIAVQGNPLLAYESMQFNALATGMLDAMTGLSYHGGSIDWQGDPSVTCGDMVMVTDLKAEGALLLILDQTITLDGGFSMTSGNTINSATKGRAKQENLRVFTPTGRLNATALEGDINIRAGEQLNLLAGANALIKAGANLNMEAGSEMNAEADLVRFTTDSFNILNKSDRELLRLEEDELAVGADVISADRYVGPIVGVHNSATVPWRGSIQASLDDLPKYLAVDCILLVPSGTYNEDIVVTGFNGSRLRILLSGGVRINGSININNCGNFELQGHTDKTSIIVSRNVNYCIQATAVPRLFISYIRVVGKPRSASITGTLYGMAIYSCQGAIENCVFDKLDYCVSATYGTVMFLASNTGGVNGGTDPATYANLIAAYRARYAAVFYVYGTMPYAVAKTSINYADIYGVAETPEAPDTPPPAPPTEVVTLYSAAFTAGCKIVDGATAGSATFSTAHYLSQGLFLASGKTNRLFGLWMLPTITNRAGATKVTITVQRDGTGGTTSAVPFRLYYTTTPWSTISGVSRNATSTRALFLDTGLQASLQRGQRYTFTLTGAALTAFKNGTLSGFGMRDRMSADLDLYFMPMSTAISLEVTTT